MDDEKANECPLASMDGIKTHNNEQEREIAENTEILVSNELLLLREEDLKVELDNETITDDPLNIINKLEIKIETPEISVEFNGAYNDHDFLNPDSASTQTLTSDMDYPTSSPKRKRMHSAVGELEKLKVDHFDNAMLQKTMAPVGKGLARIVKNVLDAWDLLFDEKILTNVLKHTNDEIRKRKSKASDKNIQRMLDLSELNAWIGLNYLYGIFGKSGATLEELWTVELGNGIFRASMPLKRFEYISECLRLGEKAKTRRKPDFDATLQSVTEVWEQFIANCCSYYEPGANCTVQEHVLDMSSTDYPKQLGISLEAEPTFCGMRVISLHDSKTHYICNALLAKSPAADGAEVLALICDIKNSKRNITLSKRYTSLKLAQNLLQCRLSLVGSLAPKSKDLPPEFSKSKKETVQKLKVGNDFSFITQNSGSEVLLTSGISAKINAEKLYAATIQSGQRFYQSAACFSTTAIFNVADSTTTTQSSWPLRFFHAMLDFACINAWLLFRISQQGDAEMQQRDFQRQLGLFLAQQHLKRLLHKNAKTPLQRKLLISDILGESPDNLLSEAVSAAAQASMAGNTSCKYGILPGHIQLLPKRTEKRHRCRICTWRDNNLTGWQCQQCARAMCQSHLITRCEQCLGIELKSKEDEEQDDYFK